METIYIIKSGIKRAVEDAESKGVVLVEKKQSDWPEKTKTSGQIAFANTAWSTDIDDLVSEIKERTDSKFEVEITEAPVEIKEHENKFEVDNINKFFETRKAISKRAIAREAGISMTMLDYILSGERSLTDKVKGKLLHVLRRYGYEL